ncbi:MAG: hypothetical protein B7Z55_11140 [Planctomycetales bacterium 12-60-4]|nr:MAG: hypothetical protein B7Z55_11140 [Planctomycetales bacterium 12-60-4]
MVCSVSAGADVTEAQVAEWVAQLNAPTAAVRSAAIQHLEAAGPDILPWLPELDRETPPAVRDALTRLRQQLERELARRSILPSRVTLHAAATLESALEALRNQTQNPLQIKGLSETLLQRRWDIDWKDAAYWNAVTDLEQRTQLSIRWNNEVESFAVAAAPTSTASISGPARFVLDGAQLRSLQEDADRRLLRCAARLQMEPRLRPLFAQVKMSDWTVAADNHPQEPWNPAADYELSFPDRTSEITLPLDFRWTAAADATWRMAGRATVHLAAGREVLSFAGPTLIRGAIQKRGGVSARVQDARFEDDPQGGLRARIRIVVNYEQGGPAFESHRVGLFHRSAWLEDRAAAKIPATDFEVTAEADGGLGIEYRFEKLTGKPVDYRFNYEAPTLLLPVVFDFSVADLPAPRLAVE